MIDFTSGAPLTEVYQLGYVTTDLAQGMELFRTRHGVPSFKDLGEVVLPLDGGASVAIRFALCFVGALQLEIIQPIRGEDRIYRQLLPASGFGMVWHHVACRVPSLDMLESARAAVTKGGHDIALSGGDPKVARFFYVDARKTLGHHIEYLYVSPERLAFHADLPHH